MTRMQTVLGIGHSASDLGGAVEFDNDDCICGGNGEDFMRFTTTGFIDQLNGSTIS